MKFYLAPIVMVFALPVYSNEIAMQKFVDFIKEQTTNE